MTGFHHSIHSGKHRQKRGAATFLIAIILLIVATMIVIFAANFANLHTKSISNQTRAGQAFAAAQAGLEYGYKYLETNYSTIVASQVSGLINYTHASVTNVNLPNGSSFSVVYTNPTVSDYDVIHITSTGTSDDGLATRVISQEIKSQSLLMSSGTNSITTLGGVSVGGSSSVINTGTNQTILSGGSVVLTGSGTTVTSGGVSSTSSGTGPDVSQNNGALASMTADEFFGQYFGTANQSAIKSQVTNLYSNTVDTNYSDTLAGVTGQSIWIDQATGTVASINGNVTIGSAANPVLLIVNGDFVITGNVNIYGFVFSLGVSGISATSGNINIYGGMASTGNIVLNGNASMVYDAAVLTNLANQNATRYYAKIPGTWKDF